MPAVSHDTVNMVWYFIWRAIDGYIGTGEFVWNYVFGTTSHWKMNSLFPLQGQFMSGSDRVSDRMIIAVTGLACHQCRSAWPVPLSHIAAQVNDACHCVPPPSCCEGILMNVNDFTFKPCSLYALTCSLSLAHN